ncbi:hypothetical protein HYH03_012652 [Edaphochlamys debaryana]|uniref:J domain-containing protein n=1 Tax=Edaphochlamys debaryana TaxID=47281 RepID=A0A835XV26_9CHLO|nr:hypothetical protein HYH03_012652 [Edaphochlamys debaryana]|eukprot:KAG2488856.1 hypothetical protein HYH03_012652 [Edaphochlamys debaryana]
MTWETKDYFILLGLPDPDVDELGRPVWACGEVEVSKAYRKLSIAVHPDKNPGDDEARKAFEVLNKAHRMLKDPTSREDVLRGAADKARRRKEQQEASADLTTRMQLNAAKNERARELRKQEGQGLQASILEQMKRRQEEAKRRAEAEARAKARERERNGDGEGDGDEEQGRHGWAPGGRGGPGPAGAGPGAGTGMGAAGSKPGARPAPKPDSDDDDAALEALRNKRRKKPTFM